MTRDSDWREPGRSGSSARGEEEGTIADLLNSFSFDSGGSKRKKKDRREPAEAPRRAPSPEDAVPKTEDIALESLDPLLGVDSAAPVRAYAWTRGRTRSEIPLQLETLVSTSDLGRQQARQLGEEHYAITGMCHSPRSVAEIAALLSVPIGVARVLVGDMAESGLVVVHQTAAADSDNLPNLNLMERVLSGLRRL